jgi:hypothetical protein
MPGSTSLPQVQTGSMILPRQGYGASPTGCDYSYKIVTHGTISLSLGATFTAFFEKADEGPADMLPHKFVESPKWTHKLVECHGEMSALAPGLEV